MARKIVCNNCDDRIKKSAEKYGEFYQSRQGLALTSYFCDSCGIDIDVDEECSFALLLSQAPPEKTIKRFFEEEPKKFIYSA